MFGTMAALAFLLYCCIPGDNSGVPYPKNKDEIQQEIVFLEQWFKDNESEFQKCYAYTEMNVSNDFWGKETRKAVVEYNDWLRRRRIAKYRLNNLKKLWKKYEEIDAASHVVCADNGV